MHATTVVNHLARALIVAFLSGAIAALAFAPYGVWPVMILSLAIFMWLCQASHTYRRAAACGYAYGLGLFTFTVSYVGVIGWWAAVAIIVVLAGWTTALAVVWRFLIGIPGWQIWSSAAWISMEALWCRFPFGGFGWDRLAYTTADQPLGGYLWLLGSSGTGFLVCLTAALALTAVTSRRRTIVISLALLVAIFGLGHRLRSAAIPHSDPDLVLGVVQGDVSGTAGSQAMGYAASVTNNHYSETIMLLAKAATGIEQQPDIIVWPENATDNDPRYDDRTAWILTSAETLAAMPIMVGAVMAGPGEDERQTTMLWWEPERGITTRYDKQNAVPFGEFTPMRDLVFAVAPMARQVGRQTVEGEEPGAVPVTVDGREIVLGPIICWELAFDETVYETTTNGAELMIVQSNNATYTGTHQPLQQFEITRIRAMELRRPITVATTSSYSGFIEADGSVVYRSDEASNASTTLSVATYDNVTPAARWGLVIEGVIASLSVLGLLIAIRLRKHGRADTAVGHDPGRDAHI